MNDHAPPLQDFEHRVAAVDWNAYARPPWSDAAQLRAALSTALHADGRSGVERAYGALLNAVGNNHAGTYWPVAVPLLPWLGELMAHGSIWSRRAALEVFVDLAGSFEPERGHEQAAPELARQAWALRPRLEAIAAGNDEDTATALLGLLGLTPPD
ncbi:hypothetical protein [Lysobacter silvisoli]|uniref:Uncharacterized protein n=1 Tax=Lysobacter silvisoli TaxID=2293254 RepID=A0A371K637_9GAMM|nr:hypothetical protein [Lysobacter silvisoli]RDZ29375.1 hypothetical protein DX914_09920 [Lysobacter silvisoli]